MNVILWHVISKTACISKNNYRLTDSMLFSKFNALQKDHSILDRVRSLETEIDVIEEKLQEDLFASERELAEKLQLSELYVFFGDISDIIEDIADKIQILLIARKA